MSEPRTSEQGPEPAGDLRSVLLTSVLQLEPLDVDLFRRPHCACPVSGGAHAHREELLRALGQGHPAWEAHLHMPGFFPTGAAQPGAAPVPNAGCAAPRGTPDPGAADPEVPAVSGWEEQDLLRH
uniref:Acyl-CoA thioesterase 8 n=1 Tax=Pseudonaja textilis TaxID=8673 RepID=A0A670ZSL5_PSETE